MAIQLHFLGAGVPLTKTFSLDNNGKLDKSSYPMVKNFTSYTETVATLTEFHAAVVNHASLGHCLLKGELDMSLANESRAGHTSPNDMTEYVVFDIDGLPYKPDEFMKIIGYDSNQYFVQYSASAGVIRSQDNGSVTPSMNRYHIFAMLDKPHRPDELKNWLKHLNLSKPELSDSFDLTATNMCLSWPLDIGVCQNDKLIYISPPECSAGVLDTIAQTRITKVNGGAGPISANINNQALLQLNRSLEIQQINEMRLRRDLPAKQAKSTTCKGVAILANPDLATVTGIRSDREFVYLNLNGGDSWAYYHPETNADVIYNFKDEPNYRTETLDPVYYASAKELANSAKKKSKSLEKIESAKQYVSEQKLTFEQEQQDIGQYHCMFRDRETDTYFTGYYDFSSSRNNFNKVRSKDAGYDYLTQYSCVAPDPVLTWDYQYQPSNIELIDLDLGFVNKFQPSKYMISATVQPDLLVPENIGRLINNALGSEQQMFDHFINWLAVIFQYRTRTESAWVLQGTSGTGKGALFNSIIKPLIGDDNCRLVTLQSLEENFNGFAERCLVLFVDEVDTDQVRQQQKLIAKLKSWITEPKLPVRAMRTDLREVDNYLNIIMASNQPNSMRIEINDRRINVCPRQEGKLLRDGEDGHILMKSVESELDEFANYLQSYTCDLMRARTPIENEAKQTLQATTQTAIEEVAQALKSGDLQYFIDHKPSNEGISHYANPVFDGCSIDINEGYNKVLDQALICITNGNKHLFKHEALFVLFQSLVGKIPSTKAKLTHLLNHHGINIKTQTVDGRSVRGIKVQWQPITGSLSNEVISDISSIPKIPLVSLPGSNIASIIALSKEYQAAQKFKK